MFIPSYFDYVRVRNALKKQLIPFCSLSEHETPQQISRARGDLFHGKVPLVLITERFYFFKRFSYVEHNSSQQLISCRYKIRGLKHILFYALPEHAQFYSEMIEMLEGDDRSCMVLFAVYERMRLERIVGTARMEKLVSSEKDVHIFC